MTNQNDIVTTPEEPRKKTDWAARRAQSETAAQAGLDRVAAAYREQRETPFTSWAQEFKAEMEGRAAMRQTARQLKEIGAAERYAQHLAALKTMTPTLRAFSAAAYEVPAAKTAIRDFEFFANGDLFSVAPAHKSSFSQALGPS